MSSEIALPNGLTALITHQGSVKLTTDIVLLNVLYVPHFKYNLLSAGKLAHYSKYCLSFNPSYYTFQDLEQMKLREIGNKLVAYIDFA